MSKDPKLIKQSDRLWKEYTEETQETFWPKYNGLIREAKALVKPFAKLQATTQKPPPLTPKPQTTPNQKSTSKRWPYKVKLVSAPIKTSVTARKRWLIAGGFMLLVGLLFGLEYLPKNLTSGGTITDKLPSTGSYGLYLGNTKVRLKSRSLTGFERMYNTEAQDGNAKAQYVLGCFYIKPKLKLYNAHWSKISTMRNLKVDSAKALQLFLKSAQQGHNEAKLMAGLLYLKRGDV